MNLLTIVLIVLAVCAGLSFLSVPISFLINGVLSYALFKSTIGRFQNMSRREDQFSTRDLESQNQYSFVLRSNRSSPPKITSPETTKSSLALSTKSRVKSLVSNISSSIPLKDEVKASTDPTSPSTLATIAQNDVRFPSGTQSNSVSVAEANSEISLGDQNAITVPLQSSIIARNAATNGQPHETIVNPSINTSGRHSNLSVIGKPLGNETAEAIAQGGMSVAAVEQAPGDFLPQIFNTSTEAIEADTAREKEAKVRDRMASSGEYQSGTTFKGKPLVIPSAVGTEFL